MSNSGYKVMLLADCLGEYGSDNSNNFPGLLRKLRGIDNRIQFALNNFNLVNFIQYFDEMTEFLKQGYFCHLNLPIQSASDRVLKLMNRPYKRKDIETVFGWLNDIEFTEFDTHLIAGFPGETAEEFYETIEFLLKYHPKYVLVSGYLETPKMASFNLSGKISDDIKLRRLDYAKFRFDEVGIICNTDNSQISKDRFRKLNSVGLNRKQIKGI